MTAILSLDNLDKAKALVEQAGLLQLKEIISRADALKVYAQQAKRGLEIQNQCAEIKLRAEKRLGGLLAEMPKQAGARGIGKKVESQEVTPLSTLKDIGLTKMQSSRYQAVASLPDKEFEKHIAEVKKSNEELTTVGVIKLARDLKQADRTIQDLTPPLISKIQHPKEFLNNVVTGDCLEVLKLIPDNTIDSLVTDPPAGIGFMHKEWDGDKGGRDKWIGWLATRMHECLRVLKPGGHALVWALPRTSHWTGTALEDAGFEVRDCVSYLFATGFPKSHNISKAIEKHKGVKSIGRKDPVGGMMGKGMQEKGWNPIHNALIMPETQTDEGKLWQGWGTALKPAVEHWWLVQKPLSEGTFAKNVLKWGVGGLNIDASRVETSEVLSAEYGSPSGSGIYNWNQKKQKGQKTGLLNTKGRWPANLICDHSQVVLEDFPKAKFFYCPKPSTAERDKGLEDTEVKENLQGLDSRGRTMEREDGTKTLVDRWKGTPRANNHPTVKALALMEYLIKLITPPKGIVLDCFAGSGSTLVAAKTLGHPFIGIELSPEYVKLAKTRLNINSKL